MHGKKLLLALLTAAAVTQAHAAIIISEVDPTGSSNGTYGADWFELTNTGSSAVNISGWKMDDNSNAFATAVTLSGVTSIAAGQSAVFLEGATALAGSDFASIDAAFKTVWFGSNVPAGFTIGNYYGSNVGLSASADAVNIFDSTGAKITGVNFNVATTGVSFDNKAGLNNAAISTLSSVGVNGAFTSANGAEIGSPGAVPLPGALPLMMSALGLIGAARLRRKNHK